MGFTDEEKRREIEREIKMRKRVYPRWVSDGKMDKAEADRRIAILEAVAEDYRAPGLFDHGGADDRG